MTRLPTLIAAAAALAVAGCDLLDRPGQTGEPPASPAAPEAPAAPSAGGFRHSQTGDLSGYYMPVGTIEVNNHRLHHLFIGQAREFEAWEKGERTATFAPVMLQFDDLSSPTGTNELGQTYYERTVRVLPAAYEVTDEAVRFEGDSALGRVSFEGRLDGGALATARRNLGGGEAPVLTGTLRVGGSTVSNAKFTWFGGD